MLSVWFIAGPPFDTCLWADTARRLNDLGLHTHFHPLLRSGTGDIASEVQRLTSEIEASDHEVILVGQGTALPLVLDAALTGMLRGVVLANGVLDRPGPLSKSLFTLARLPNPIGKLLFHPSLSLRFLASSVGLRRTVINPYVMEHDTVVAICGPILTDPSIRTRAQNYLRSIAKTSKPRPKIDLPTLICWGDEDYLNVDNYKIFLDENKAITTLQTVSGGRFLHPVERPWEIADMIFDWSECGPTTT